MTNYKLRISGKHYNQLKGGLYPGDGMEAGALAVCGRHSSDQGIILLVQKVFVVPAEAYLSRKRDFLEWDTEWVTDIINDAEAENLSLIKFHSHPGGWNQFSKRDDLTDIELLNEWTTWYDTDTPHGSVIMLPNGEMFGRVLYSIDQFIPFQSIAVAGDQYHYWIVHKDAGFIEAESRNLQTFGAGTTAALKNLKIGIVGASGTGSVAIEQLARLGVGHLVIVDPDRVEEKNLNRILNATRQDAVNQRYKVDVLGDAIEEMGFSTIVTKITSNLASPEAIREMASCDVLFGCMDGAEGRHVLNRIASYYVTPYLDVGIALQAKDQGGILQITGAVHYIQPSGSSLLSRGVYSLDEVEAESMQRMDPDLYTERRKQNYIAEANEDSPAVIPVNMHYASLMILEFLARLHQYRITNDAELAMQQYNLEDIDNHLEQGDGNPCEALEPKVGRGDVAPLLDMTGME